MAELQLRGINKSFGMVRVIEDVNLDIGDGEFVVFVGPSGCGKSTLLRTISGLEEPTAGQVLIGGEDVTDFDPSERGVAMVFQSYALYPHMTVRENLAFGLRRRRFPADEISKRVDQAGKVLGLEPYLARKPHALSGGQRQRVALGRAIVRDPKVFLFDEPLSNLDAALRVSTRTELVALHERLGATMIYVTHDQVEAMTMGTRICIMNAGRVAQVGAPLEVYRNPVNTFVAAFLGSPPMNLVPAIVRQGPGGWPRLDLGGGCTLDLSEATARHRRLPPDGSPVVFGIRPEDIAVSSTGVTGQVEICEALGAETLLSIRIGGGEKLLRARVDRTLHPSRGDRITLHVAMGSAILFDHATGESLAHPSPSHAKTMEPACLLP